MLDGALDQTIDEYYGRVFGPCEFREKMRQFFEKFDVADPTTPVAAFDLGRDIRPT